MKIIFNAMHSRILCFCKKLLKAMHIAHPVLKFQANIHEFFKTRNTSKNRRKLYWICYNLCTLEYCFGSYPMEFLPSLPHLHLQQTCNNQSINVPWFGGNSTLEVIRLYKTAVIQA